jgi:hypothetical protein
MTRAFSKLSALAVFAAGAIVSSAAFSCPFGSVFIPHQAQNGSGVCFNLMTNDRFSCVARAGRMPCKFQGRGASFCPPRGPDYNPVRELLSGDIGPAA